MKKILPLILLLPCVAMGATNTSFKASNRAIITTTAGTRHVSDKLAKANKQEAAFVLTGFVRDASGQPLPGVAVMIKGATTGTQTDINGKFTLSVNTGEVLVFSYIGYVKKEVVVTAANQLTIEMSEDSKQLSEVVVTALGIKKERKALGYSVSEVKGSDVSVLKKQTSLAH